MGSITAVAAQLPPEFWLEVPAMLFSAVALAAVMRARREDIPKVLSIITAIFTSRRGGQPGSADETGSLDGGDSRPPLPRRGHHGTLK